jgi:hypothetical protein
MENEETLEISQEQLDAIFDFRDGLLDLVADLSQNEAEVPPYEVIYNGVIFFAKMAFDMAPSEEVARETIKAGIETAYEEWVMEERECCPNCSVTH